MTEEIKIIFIQVQSFADGFDFFHIARQTPKEVSFGLSELAAT
jgi:hypothetical protein